MQQQITQTINDCIQAVQQLKTPEALLFIEQAAIMISDCFQKGNKVLIAGNGGSLCDASHFAEELTGVFRKKRAALPVIPLTDPGHLTCTANDYGFEWVFARGVEAYGKPDDIFIGLTTSGQSLNLMKAFVAAQQLGLKTIALLGKGGGRLKDVADLELVINGFPTSDRVQEAHMAALHVIIEFVEYRLFPSLQKDLPTAEKHFHAQVP